MAGKNKVNKLSGKLFQIKGSPHVFKWDEHDGEFVLVLREEEDEDNVTSAMMETIMKGEAVEPEPLLMLNEDIVIFNDTDKCVEIGCKEISYDKIDKFIEAYCEHRGIEFIYS